MVRLKDTDEVKRAAYLLFQFHYGTIKSFSQALKILLFITFQFHYGTIKSPQHCGLCAPR